MEIQTAILDKFSTFRGEINKVVKGQDAIVAGLVIGLVTEGHVLLEGMPGVAKTFTVRVLAMEPNLRNTRVQFTPNLVSGDLTGSLIFNSQTSTFTFHEGPVFANLLLADEVSHIPPKTQSALLETTEEHQVSADGVSRELPNPSMVTTTQDLIGYGGIYPLPEAQLDRFLLKLEIPLSSRDTELKVLNLHLCRFNSRTLVDSGLRLVASAEDIVAAHQAVESVNAGPEVLGYVVDLVRATRTPPQVELGVSPCGATALLAISWVRARLCGRDFVIPNDIKSLVLPTFRHWLRLHAEAEMEGVTAQPLLDTVLSTTPASR